jgi:adenylate kinase family enzyme
VNDALHTAGEVHVPQSRVPPQPSSGLPHEAPSAPQVVGVHPQTLSVPPPPHVSGSVHVPQSSTPVQRSGISPQSFISSMQVVGVHGPLPQRFGMPIAPHTSSGPHVPHSIVPPQPSLIGPHSAPSAAQVVGTHGPESRTPLPASGNMTSPSAPTRGAPPRSRVQDQARRHALTTSLLMQAGSHVPLRSPRLAMVRSRMRRVSVVGNTGSGKTTFARALAHVLRVPHVELDALNHQPGWKPAPDEQLRADVRRAIDREGWVVDGNYGSKVGDIVWSAADTVVWLDYGRARVLSRVVRRTLKRVVTREELWNGNRERFENIYRLDPEENVILWSWMRHAHYRALYSRAMDDGANAHLRFVRLRHPRESEAFLSRARKDERAQIER